MKNILKSLTIFAVALMAVVPVLTVAQPANAQSADNMLWGGYESNVQTQSGLGNEDPRVLAGRVIKVMLGFLGIIAVVIILIGGFKWMTAGGNEDGIGEAKAMIGAGVIGLVIVLSSFGLAQFVISALYDATAATG